MSVSEGKGAHDSGISAPCNTTQPWLSSSLIQALSWIQWGAMRDQRPLTLPRGRMGLCLRYDLGFRQTLTLLAVGTWADYLTFLICKMRMNNSTTSKGYLMRKWDNSFEALFRETDRKNNPQKMFTTIIMYKSKFIIYGRKELQSRLPISKH